jgi:hypothetical protein
MSEEICYDCGTPHKPGEECEICVALLRVQKLARERRKEYAIKKRGERIDEEEPKLPYADD